VLLAEVVHLTLTFSLFDIMAAVVITGAMAIWFSRQGLNLFLWAAITFATLALSVLLPVWNIVSFAIAVVLVFGAAVWRLSKIEGT